MAEGNSSNVKPVGQGVCELRIDRGPGFRIYFGWVGSTLVVLLGGGTKRRQSTDIARAIASWADYKRRRAAMKRM